MKPELVVITEPSNLQVCRGQRGRMEIEVLVHGRSCHASAPNAREPIYRMGALLRDVEELNARLRTDPFLGKATITVTEIRSVSASSCAVPSTCSVHVDRRLIRGETKSPYCEIRRWQEPEVQKSKCSVSRNRVIPDWFIP